jgi:hypothetical protein
MGQQTKEKWVQAVHVSNGRINVLWPEWAEKRKELKHYCQIGSSSSDTTGYTTGSRLSFLPAIMTTSSRMHGEFLRLLFLQAHRETTAHFIATGLPSQQTRSDNAFRFKRAAFYMGLKSKVGLVAAKASALRINLNIQDCSIVAPTLHAPSRAPLLT